jgi:hypothetical protein
MAWGFRVTCSDCLHQWEGISMSLWFGPHVVLEADEMQSLFCPRCYQRLCFPRTLERRTWQRWREHFLSREEEKSSFLRSLVAVVDASLAASRWYTPVAVRLPSLDCPQCRTAFVPTSDSGDQVICPQCEGASTRVTGYESHVNISSDHPEGWA